MQSIFGFIYVIIFMTDREATCQSTCVAVRRPVAPPPEVAHAPVTQTWVETGPTDSVQNWSSEEYFFMRSHL